MSRTRRFLTALRSVVMGGPAQGSTALRSTVQASTAQGSTAGGPPAPPAVPGQSGPDATIELDASALGRMGWGYAPESDGAPDPGEIVWTWVPYEEQDGRGKDRPVVIMATLSRGNLLAVQLTSKDHTGDDDYVPLGVGPWDRDRRPSWAGIGRVFQVRQGGVRREGTLVDAKRYAVIERALRARYRWR